MSCPKNIKTALWGLLRWEGRHRWKRYRIERIYWDWRVEYECETCNAKKLVRHVEDENLIRWGYDIEELRENERGLHLGMKAHEQPECLRDQVLLEISGSLHQIVRTLGKIESNMRSTGGCRK